MSDRQEGLRHLEEVVAVLLNSSAPDLVTLFRRFSHACGLLGLKDDQRWAQLELWGYPDENVPYFRQTRAAILWRPNSSKDALTISLDQFQVDPDYPPVKYEPASIYASVDRLQQARANGFSEPTGESTQIRMRREWITAVSDRKILPANVGAVLEAITNRLFTRASELVAASRLGQAVSDVFDTYRAEVEPKLADLGFREQLDELERGLSARTDAGNQTALMAARNIIHALSDFLVPRDVNEHPTLTSRDGGRMKIDRDKPRNRLIAYLHEKGIGADSRVGSQLDLLSGYIHSLYGAQSAGKLAVESGDANFAAIMTYVFVGELVRLTDMQPITEMR